MPILRRTFLEMGRRLVAAGVLDGPEEIFHLRLAELERVSELFPPSEPLSAQLRAAAARRKAARARLENTPLVDPRLLIQTEAGSPLLEAGDPLHEAGGPLLRGMAGSPGAATGPARIVRDGSEFDRLLPGDVLVAPYTNPSWTPLFQRAAAVVVDTGSPASHAAIVAREYGIPAVMGTRNATRVLRDGDLIRVDGSRGAVYRMTPAPREEDGGETPAFSGTDRIA
jgi:pyruvate,water dikinase